MADWLDNTIRTIVIIVLSGFVLIVSAFFFLLSLCARGMNFGGSNSSGEGGVLLLIALAVLIGGIFGVSQLARALFRSSPETVSAVDYSILSPAPAQTEASKLYVPLHLSPLGQRAVNHLALAMAVQIVLSPIGWILSQLHFWTPLRPYSHAPFLILAVAFILHHLPYAILIYLLLKQPTRFAFTYSVAVPAVLLLQSLFSISIVGVYLTHNPIGLVLLLIPWSIHIVVLVLSYKAIQQVGLHPQPASLLLAAIAIFFYFSIIQSVTALLYRL